MIRIIFTLLLVFSLSLKANNNITKHEFLQYLQELHTEPSLKNSSLSVSIYKDDQKNAWLDYFGHINLSPASNLKLLVTATGWLVLPKDFTFSTKISTCGNIINDTLYGDLYIIGGGDPTLGEDNLFQTIQGWREAICDNHIRYIDGKIVGHAGIFEKEITPGTWIWEDIGNWYGAGISGLSIHNNLYHLYFSSGKNEGDSTQIIGLFPSIDHLSFINEVLSGSINSGDNAYIYGGNYSYNKHIKGSIPANRKRFSIKGSIPDPAYFTAKLLHEELESANIKIYQSPMTFYGLIPSSCNDIVTYESRPIREIITQTNFYSNNLYSESIFKMIGKKLRNAGSLKGASISVKQYWKNHGIDLQNISLEDGSGLSRYNSLTTNQLARLLIFMINSPEGYGFEKSLPIVGKQGSVRNIRVSRLAKDRIRAKSGSIKKVRAYSGYVTTLNNQKVSFSLIINNYNGTYYSLNPIIEQFFNIIAKI